MQLGGSDTKERECTLLQELDQVTFLLLSSGRRRGTSDLLYRLVSCLLLGRSLESTAK